MRELRAISSRATISRTRFSNYYTYGDLKANPPDLLIGYFDASLSFTHWFYVELAFRFPKTAVDVRRLRRYAAGQSLDVHSMGGDVVVAVAVERDDFDPENDGQGWLSSWTAIRADIAGGDVRALYLAWLLDVQAGDIDDDVVEPARPHGLGSLSPALDRFIDIMGLDRDLVAAAVGGATKVRAMRPAREVERWIAGLKANEHITLLSRVAHGDGSVGGELMRRFRQQAPGHAATLPLRTAGELRARAEELAEHRRKVVLARQAKARMHRDRVQAAARDRHPNMLAKRQTDAWRRVDALIVTTRPWRLRRCSHSASGPARGRRTEGWECRIR